MKKVMFLFTALLLLSCSENNTGESEPTDENAKENQEKPYMDDVRIKKHIETQLQIPANEKYEYRVYSAHLNDDDSLDRIVTVNMMDRAISDALAAGKMAKAAEMGFMGNYNYFFYIDGKSQMITSPIVVPSSPKAELKISFENITNQKYQDIQIDLRILHDCYRKFFTIKDRVPIQVSETEVFTNLGKKGEQVYAIRLEKSDSGPAKTIAVYKGTTKKVNLSTPDQVYQTEPEIKAGDELVRRWYYSPQHMKYYLKKDEL